jgi:hypothetical protein
MRYSQIAIFSAAVLFGLTAGAWAQEDGRAAMPDPGKGYFVLNEGNSLMGQMHTRFYHEDYKKERLIHALADYYGFPEHDSEGVGAAGVPIDWIWGNMNKRQEFFDDLRQNPVDLFAVQPFGFQNRREPEIEAAAAAQMYRHVLEKNPKAPLLIYQTWPSGRSPGGAHHDLEPALAENGGDAELFMKGLKLCIDEYMNPVAHILRQEFPDKPVYIMPCPQVMLEFGRRLAKEPDGELAGIKHIAELLDAGGRSVHVSRKGQFMVALTQLAGMYRKDPAETDFPVDYETVFAFNLKEGPKTHGLTNEQAKVIARLVWDVVSTYPATAVSRKEFDFEDMSAPRPAKLVASKLLSAKQAHLQWEPGRDDKAVKLQCVYRNGDLISRLDPEVNHYYVGSLTDGGENTIILRTFDKQYNYADEVVKLTPPKVKGQTVILAWDLFPYSLRGERREDEYMPATAIKATESTGVDPDKATITFGPGVGTAGRPFRHCMIISPDNFESFADSHDKGGYVKFTVAPKDGKTLSLKSLILPIKTQESGLRVTLMTSATGFDMGDQIRTLTVSDGLSEIEFPLDEVQALQSVDEPVEVRLYISQGRGQTYIGSFGDTDRTPDVWLRGQVK